MSEDPKTPKIPETPGDEPSFDAMPVSPTEPIFDSEMDYSAEASQPAETKPEGPEDEIYGLRQALLNEANRSRRGTGRLLRTLRRATGSLRKVTGAIKKGGETTSTGPLTTQPLSTGPLTTEPLSTGPLITEPLTTEPLSAETLTTEPLTTEPLSPEPLTTEQLTSEPPSPEPPADRPLTTGPLTTGPLTTGPLTTGSLTERPLTTGPLTTGPLTDPDRPLTTGPLTTGPLTTGSLTDRPLTTGPLTTGPLTTGPLTDRPLTTRQLGADSQEEGNGPSRRTSRETSFDGEGESAAFLEASGEASLTGEAGPAGEAGLDSLLKDDSPLSLLESGAIAALGQAEEEAKESSELDWMKELREEAAEEEQGGKEELGRSAPGGPPGPRAATGQLRDFINSLLGRPPTRPLDKSKVGEETGLPDDLVTGRLGQLGTGDQPAAQIISGAEAVEGEAGESTLEDTFGPSFVSGPAIGESDIFEASAEEEQASYLDGLELNFSPVGEFGTGEAGTLDLYPEDEALLWGDTGQAPAAEQAAQEGEPFNFEDLWSEREPPTSVFGADLRREIWGETEEAEPSKLDTGPLTPPAESSDMLMDALYADLYQTETGYAAGAEETEQAGEGAEEEAEAEPGDGSTADIDLRAIALQGYEEEGDLYATGTYTINWAAVEGTQEAEAAKAAVTEETPEAAAAAEEEKEKAKKAGEGWKAWLEKNKVLQKALLAEAVLAAVAMLIAVPFFVFMILRGPAKPATQVLSVNSLPANLPYPTGLTLPGGWYFPLDKSTIANGQWQPVTSEWLEGTELRRVVALPWSPQTEAVVKSFKPGDPVELTLSNNDTLKYRFSNIQRVAVSDTKIYTEHRSSLVIILYQEDANERWVVVCTP